MTYPAFLSLVPGEHVLDKYTGQIGIVGNTTKLPKGPGAVARVLVVFYKGTEHETAAWRPYMAVDIASEVTS